MPNIHDCRFLIENEGKFKKVCRIVFGKKDASLYLIPYGRQECYLWGEGTVPEGMKTATFSHANPAGEQERPKLSIHQSGQVHVKLLEGDEYKAGPLQTKPLWDFQGEHVAGITIDSIDSLPDAGKIKPKPKSPEVALRTEEIGQTRRFALYANGTEPRFDYPVKATVTMYRAGLPAPLHVGIATFAQDALTEGEEGGVTIISGWNPDKDELAEQRMLWVRAI